MSESARFIQSCPTCGRSLWIHVEYLGKQVACEHCHGRFVACEPPSAPPALSDSALLRRAEELLDLARLRAER